MTTDRLSIRLTGTITALAPIHIARPEQGDRLLTMNVIRNEAMTRTHVIPGETLKGLLRGAALRVCVDAARTLAPVRMSLDGFYRQSAGGLSFEAESRPLGSSDLLREGQPLLSLFGCASPKLRGRIIVHHALAQPSLHAPDPVGTGLPPGTRQDALAGEGGYADLMSPEDAALWMRQHGEGGIVSDASEARATLKDAERKLLRARNKKIDDTADLEAAVSAAQAAVDDIKSGAEFSHAIMRPIPVKQAAPPGTVFDHGIDVIDADPAEVGLLFATLQTWGQLPRIGGSRTAGYGTIKADYAITVLQGSGPARTHAWTPAGTVGIKPAGTEIALEHEALVGACAAWSAVEKNILAATQMFA